MAVPADSVTVHLCLACHWLCCFTKSDKKPVRNFGFLARAGRFRFRVLLSSSLPSSLSVVGCGLGERKGRELVTMVLSCYYQNISSFSIQLLRNTTTGTLGTVDTSAGASPVARLCIHHQNSYRYPELIAIYLPPSKTSTSHLELIVSLFTPTPHCFSHPELIDCLARKLRANSEEPVIKTGI